MFTRGAVSAMSLFRGPESRMFLAPLRSISALSNRASLLRPRLRVGSRSLSSQEATSGKTIFINSFKLVKPISFERCFLSLQASIKLIVKLA